MDLVSAIPHAATEVVDFPGDTVAWFLKMIADGTGLVADDSPDGPLGLVMSALAGVAAALAVAIVLAVYFRSGYRSARDIVRHGLVATAVLGLLAFVAYDMRHAALAYLGINPSKPEVEFEIRLPKTAPSALADGQIELHTDRNQTLAKVRRLASDDDGRSVLSGSVPLEFRTTNRVMILNLPGQPLREFKLRLAANPGHCDQFGPWHLTDRVVTADTTGRSRPEFNDAYAIRYRVL